MLSWIVNITTGQNTETEFVEFSELSAFDTTHFSHNASFAKLMMLITDSRTKTYIEHRLTETKFGKFLALLPIVLNCFFTKCFLCWVNEERWSLKLVLSRNSKLLLRGFLQRTTKQDHSLGDLDFQAFSRCLPQLILALIFENEKTFYLSNL